jgi:hypothetical protein
MLIELMFEQVPLNTKRTTSLLLLLTLICLPGCDVAKIPVKVEGLPNTFKREPLRASEKVLSVAVRDSEDVVWMILATEPINSKDFNVQVGATPEGFEQVIPPKGQTFTPVVDDMYSIRITTDVRNHKCAHVLQYPIEWIAEE